MTEAPSSNKRAAARGRPARARRAWSDRVLLMPAVGERPGRALSLYAFGDDYNGPALWHQAVGFGLTRAQAMAPAYTGTASEG